MTINRTTGGKGMANLLHKRGHEISHTEICHLNKSWANKVAINTNRVLPASLSTARPTHVFIDNSDRKQQTITGSKTTCYTNCMVFLLQNIKSPDKISPQHANFLTDKLFKRYKENRKFFQNVFPNFVESKRNNFKLFRLYVFRRQRIVISSKCYR